MEILFEDKDIIVVKKTAGIASQSANVAVPDLVSMIKNHLRQSGNNIQKEPYLGVVHRLDQPVAGILVFAKNKQAAADLSKQASGDIMSKKYYALVEGICQEASNKELINEIYKDSKLSKAVILNKDVAGNNIKSQKAVLLYSTVQKENSPILKNINDEILTDTSLLDIELKTGRFHQIRAQLSNISHPILGDRKYGSDKSCPIGFADNKSAKGAIALVAYSLSFRHPKTQKFMTFTY